MIAGIIVLAGSLSACPANHHCLSLEGQLARRERFERPFGPNLTFVLQPIEDGWKIVIHDDRPEENIARLTPPWHFVPNPRYIEGWHFRNADNSGPNDGTVNAPQEERDFIYAVEVGRSIDYPPTAEQMATVRNWGQGHLLIKSYELDAPKKGVQAGMTRLVFQVRLSWPASAMPSHE